MSATSRSPSPDWSDHNPEDDDPETPVMDQPAASPAPKEEKQSGPDEHVLSVGPLPRSADARVIRETFCKYGQIQISLLMKSFQVKVHYNY